MSDDTPDGDDPSYQDIIESLVDAPEDDAGSDRFDIQFQKISATGERAFAHLRGLQEHYFHKQVWSYFIAFLMLVMLVFQCILLGLVGSGRWSFKDYSWLLPALLAQNFAQIVGLAVFVVRALFKGLHMD